MSRRAGARRPAFVSAIATPWAPRALLILGVVAYLLMYVTWSLHNYQGLATYGFDLGIHDQAVWLLSRGRSPFITISGNPYFGDHLYWIMLLGAHGNDGHRKKYDDPDGPQAESLLRFGCLHLAPAVTKSAADL